MISRSVGGRDCAKISHRGPASSRDRLVRAFTTGARDRPYSLRRRVPPYYAGCCGRRPASVAGTSPCPRCMLGSLRGSADLVIGACKRGQPSGLVRNRHVNGSRSQSVSDRVGNLCLLCVAFDGGKYSWPGDSQKNLVEGKKSGLLANKGLETDLRTRSQVLIGVGSSAFALDRLSRNHI